MKKHIFLSIILMVVSFSFHQAYGGLLERAPSAKLSIKIFSALSCGYFLYKMGLLLQYGYSVSKDIYHEEPTNAHCQLTGEPKEELDKIFSLPRAQVLINTFDKPYFRIWGTLDRSTHPAHCICRNLGFEKKSSSFTIQNNKTLAPFILKMPTNFRLKTAQAIDRIIQRLELKHVAVPQKYSYRLPHTDLNIVVSEKIQSDLQVKRELTSEELNELLIVAILLNEEGIPFSDVKPDNFMILEDKVIIIDSESTTGKKFIFDEWPVHFWGQTKPNADHVMERIKTRFHHSNADRFQLLWEKNKHKQKDLGELFRNNQKLPENFNLLAEDR